MLHYFMLTLRLFYLFVNNVVFKISNCLNSYKYYTYITPVKMFKRFQNSRDVNWRIDRPVEITSDARQKRNNLRYAITSFGSIKRLAFGSQVSDICISASSPGCLLLRYMIYIVFVFHFILILFYLLYAGFSSKHNCCSYVIHDLYLWFLYGRSSNGQWCHKYRIIQYDKLLVNLWILLWITMICVLLYGWLLIHLLYCLQTFVLLYLI